MDSNFKYLLLNLLALELNQNCMWEGKWSESYFDFVSNMTETNVFSYTDVGCCGNDRKNVCKKCDKIMNRKQKDLYFILKEYRIKEDEIQEKNIILTSLNEKLDSVNQNLNEKIENMSKKLDSTIEEMNKFREVFKLLSDGIVNLSKSIEDETKCK